MVAGDYMNRNLKCLADDGRAVIIALLGGARHHRCRASVASSSNDYGVNIASTPGSIQGCDCAQLAATCVATFEGKIRPIVHATFPLQQVSDAHAMMDAGEQVGKII